MNGYSIIVLQVFKIWIMYVDWAFKRPVHPKMLHFNTLTISLQQISSLETQNYLVCQLIPSLLWKAYYHVHKSPPLDPIPSKFNPVHCLFL
jgi:hypothetical protein